MRTNFMKKVYVSFCLLFTFCSEDSFAQTNNWIWGRSAVGTGSQALSVSVNADHFGNAFITGQFHDPTISFGPFTLTNSDPSQVTTDLFIAKYDSIGNVLWAKRAGGNSFDKGWSVTTDLGGNLLVTGDFASATITFGSTTLINSSTISDVFLVKYNTTGNLLWAKSAGGSGNDIGHSVTTDNAGNIYISGYFNSPTITFGTTTLTNSGDRDAFLVKYDTNGNVIWAKSAGGAALDDFSSVCTDGYANVYVTGQFLSPTISIGSTMLTNSGNRDFLIAKYDSSGNVLWAKGAQGTSDEVGNSLSADSSGSVYVTGSFISSSVTFGTSTLTNTGNQNVFLVKYDELGNVIWARSAFGANNAVGFSASADVDGNVYVSGGFGYSDTITFGTASLSPPNGSTAPLFIVKYDLNGNVLCASALSGGGDVQNAVSADPFGNAYVTGDFWSNPFIVGNDTLILTSQYDVFVAKYDCNNNVGMNELNNDTHIALYPNPTNGIFNLDLEISVGYIFIYNILGEIVLQSKINDTQIKFDLSNQPAGIYFVNVISDSKNYSKKIIKD